MKRLLMSLGALIVAACGSPNTFSGSVQSDSFTPKEAVATLVSQNGLQIVITDAIGICQKLQQGISPMNASVLRLSLAAYDGDQQPIAISTGTYPVLVSQYQTGSISLGYFDKQDAACASAFQNTPTSTGGSINLTGYFVTGTSVSASGTYDLTFGADHVTGQFSAGPCPDLAQAETSCQ